MERQSTIRVENLNALHPLPKGRGLSAKEDKGSLYGPLSFLHPFGLGLDERS